MQKKIIKEILTYLEIPIGLIAGILITITQAIYVRDVYRKKVKPSVLSWVGWALLLGTGIGAQIIEEGWDWSQSGIMLAAFGCGAISITAIFSKNFTLERKDWLFLLIGLVCLLIYTISKDAWITTLFAILADFVIGVPTLKKAYYNPQSEQSIAWKFSLSTWTLSLVICFHHGLIYALFPVYLFLYVLVLMYFIYWRKTVSELKYTKTV